MPWTAYAFPIDASSIGTGNNWSNTTDVDADDGNYASAKNDGTATKTLLTGRYGGFSEIPAGAIIVNVEVVTEFAASNNDLTGTITYDVGLSVDGSTIDTANKKTAATYTITANSIATATPRVDTFTGWTHTLTRAQVQSDNFGPGFWAPSSVQTDADVGLDYVKVRVLWEYPGGGMIGDI